MQEAGADTTRTHNRGPIAVSGLYVAFFVVWCVGLGIGLAWPGEAQPVVLGLPLWFMLGAVLSSISVSAALVYCVRRYFQ